MAGVKIAEAKIYRYTLPFGEPVKFADKICHERNGLLLRLISTSGKSSLGEIAPLPGFSRESLEQAQNELLMAVLALNGTYIPDTLEGIKNNTDSFNELSPSVQFGIDSALLGLISTERDKSLLEILGVRTTGRVKINALITESFVSNEDELERLQKYTSVKIKVGRHSIQEDAKLINTIRQQLSPETTVRFDANRAWSYDDACSFAKLIDTNGVEYIEEPCESIEESLQFAKDSNVPLALDETLYTEQFNSVIDSNKVVAVIIKPTLYGRILKIFDLVNLLKEHNTHAVISSSFESSVGLYYLATIASAVDADYPCGLDTLVMFKGPELSSCITIDNNYATIDKLPPSDETINMQLLREVI